MSAAVASCAHHDELPEIPSLQGIGCRPGADVTRDAEDARFVDGGGGRGSNFSIIGAGLGWVETGCAVAMNRARRRLARTYAGTGRAPPTARGLCWTVGMDGWFAQPSRQGSGADAKQARLRCLAPSVSPSHPARAKTAWRDTGCAAGQEQKRQGSCCSACALGLSCHEPDEEPCALPRLGDIPASAGTAVHAKPRGHAPWTSNFPEKR